MTLRLHFPVAYGAALGVEVDAYLYYGQTREGKLRGVILEVYLIDGCLGGHVEL